MTTIAWVALSSALLGGLLSCSLLWYVIFARKIDDIITWAILDDDATIYVLRAQVETVDFGADEQPGMRWRWNVWQAGAERLHPLMLGNAATEQQAQEAAEQWIADTRSRYSYRSGKGRQWQHRLPVLLPLEVQ